ncbi:hypothetical protein O1611_g10317 [Lasiodiplodia mahajangana]|uniref:Uncharacterized protein n=1 Tax=Lasiodiplodia mahajangana TaxID=1108764 RepID=A0ACC2IZI5_9PEZI|nr:hypothetical protein O1611_g10317 [Lasiodiplodia mahajangana]
MEYRTKEPENQSVLQRFGRWLALKQYQIEVTFGVYMFTPTEKFIFWSVVFLLSAMGSIATILYLPQHILFIINRAWFYVNGGESNGVFGSSNVVAAAKNALSLSLDSVDPTNDLTSIATETLREL